MKFISKDLEDAAKAAIEMEEEGYKIYVSAAEKTNNMLGKKTFQAIAEKELLHKAAIEKFYQAFTGAATVKFNFNEANQWSKRVKNEVLNGIKDEINKTYADDGSLLKAYEITMGMEKKSYDLYKKLSEETDDTEAKKLFSYLSKEEDIHYQILEDTHLYLSNPSEWFHKEERWLVEG